MKFLTILIVSSCSLTITLAGNVERSRGNDVGLYQENESSDANGPNEYTGGKTRKYVSIFLGPEDSSDSESKIIRVPGGGGKNINIIFVKTPSSSSQQKTEVILPEQPEQRNLVYVLLKKPEASDNIRIIRPQNSPRAKPEVYFIRYSNKDASKENKKSENFGAPSDNFASTGFSISQSQSYGLP